MKILHAPVNIANQGWLLSRGQRLAGHQAELHAAASPVLRYPADRTIGFNEGPRKDRVAAAFRYLAEVVESDYEVFHFYYHASLLPRSYGIEPHADLPILRGLGKKVFFHLVGCDFRLPELSHARNPQTMCVACRACAGQDKVSVLERIARSATGLIAAGPHSQLFTGDFRFATLPVAVNLETLRQGEGQRAVPRVVHMPTNRAIKGTDAVLAAVERLRAAGVRFEFELIEGMPHEQAIERLRHADVLVDQLGSDFHATAAIEAMAMGRVVVGGMLPEAAGQYGEPSPVVAVDRRTLEEVLAGLLPDVDRRRHLAEQGASYAARHHGHVQVARRCLEIYAATTPPVPPGADAAEMAAELRLQVRRASAAFAATAPVAAGEGASATRPVTMTTSASGGGGGGGVATLEAPATATAAVANATTQTAAAADAPRFPFPVEPLANPRLALPLHERFWQSLEDYVDDKFRLGRAFFRRRLEELGLGLDGPVLDMGCGPGQWALTIAEANPELPVTACDRNDFLYGCLVEKKREMGLSNLRTVQADIRELPFEDAAFATVLCIGVLQLVTVSRAFAELVRVTRPGGRILINVPGAGFYARNSVGAIRGGRRDILRQNLKFVRNTLRRRDVPFTYFTPARLRRMAAEHGLRLTRIEPTGLYPPQKPRFLGLTVNMDVIFERPAS